MPRIALFGGSFDPPHLGHVYAAVHAHLVGEAAEAWVLPSAKPPYPKALQPWAQRWALCRLAFADLPFVHLRDDELRSTGFTIDLLGLLAASNPGVDWLLVGGTDTARDLPNWKQGDELARRLRVHAVPRGGLDQHPGALPAISSSLIRERLAAGGSTEGLLPAAVARMIRDKGWYLSPRSGLAQE